MTLLKLITLQVFGMAASVLQHKTSLWQRGVGSRQHYAFCHSPSFLFLVLNCLTVTFLFLCQPTLLPPFHVCRCKEEAKSSAARVKSTKCSKSQFYHAFQQFLSQEDTRLPVLTKRTYHRESWLVKPNIFHHNLVAYRTLPNSSNKN